MRDKSYLLFFELIQVALNKRDTLSYSPSEDDWINLFESGRRQGLIGIAFCGLQKLSQEQLIALPHHLKLQWIALAVQIRHNNDLATKRCRELQATLNVNGFRCVVLKGQGVAALYPQGLRDCRQSGDIDVWVDGTRKQVIEYAVGIKPNGEFDEKHVHFDCFADIPVELHWTPVKKWNPRWNRFLNQYFEKEKERQFSQPCEGVNFPTVDFQLTHQLLHVLGHFLSGGIGLRQMMDLCFAQKACFEQMPEKVPEVLALFKEMGLMGFVAATQWVLKEVFYGETDSNYQLLCPPNEKEGKSLLDEIEAGGNFGQYNADNARKDKTVFCRFWRKWTRLMKYDFLGAIVMPFARLKLEIWIRMERHRLKV